MSELISLFKSVLGLSIEHLALVVVCLALVVVFVSLQIVGKVVTGKPKGGK